MVGCHTLMTRDKVFVRSRRKACWTVFLNGPLKQRSAVQSLFLFALSLILVSSQHCSVEGLATALTSILNICTLKPWNHSLRSSFRASEKEREREREREREHFHEFRIVHIQPNRTTQHHLCHILCQQNIASPVNMLQIICSGTLKTALTIVATFPAFSWVWISSKRINNALWAFESQQANNNICANLWLIMLCSRPSLWVGSSLQSPPHGVYHIHTYVCTGCKVTVKHHSLHISGRPSGSGHWTGANAQYRQIEDSGTALVAVVCT